MDNHSRRALGALVFLLMSFSLLIGRSNPRDLTYPELNDEEIISRLQNLSQKIVEPKWVPAVKGYIRSYMVRNRTSSEIILGRTVLYFPIFEAYLSQYNLPEELKYLSVVESALNPKATSRVGAGGLWQFMPATGLELGLQIDKEVDERSDPIKSTEAAMVHIQRQYDRFEDWSLALAAYNSGSGRVSRAVKRARSKNFWQIQRYLPKETRNYVPAFIAATYLMDYYEEHDLKPVYPDLDLQITETIKLYDSLSFEQIVLLTELPMEVVQWLNAPYRKGLIPASVEGHSLTLPRRVMSVVKEYLESRRPDAREGAFAKVNLTLPKSETRYYKSNYIVLEGKTLPDIARELKCTVHQLRAWNKLKNNKIEPGQKLTIFTPKPFEQKFPIVPLEAITPIPSIDPNPLPVEHLQQVSLEGMQPETIYFTARRRMKVSAIAERFPGLSLDLLLELNQLAKDKMVKPGEQIILDTKWFGDKN